MENRVIEVSCHANILFILDNHNEENTVDRQKQFWRTGSEMPRKTVRLISMTLYERKALAKKVTKFVAWCLSRSQNVWPTITNNVPIFGILRLAKRSNIVKHFGFCNCFTVLPRSKQCLSNIFAGAKKKMFLNFFKNIAQWSLLINASQVMFCDLAKRSNIAWLANFNYMRNNVWSFCKVAKQFLTSRACLQCLWKTSKTFSACRKQKMFDM